MKKKKKESGIRVRVRLF